VRDSSKLLEQGHQRGGEMTIDSIVKGGEMVVFGRCVHTVPHPDIGQLSLFSVMSTLTYNQKGNNIPICGTSTDV